MSCTLPAGIDADWLSDNFLWGMPLVARNGQPITETMLNMVLCSALNKAQVDTGLELLPVSVGGTDTGEGITALEAERRDIDHNSKGESYQMLLLRRPVRSITRLNLRYGKHESVYHLPTSWNHLRYYKNGETEIIIDRSTAAFEAMTGWPFIFGSGMHGTNRMPSWFEWFYEAGFHPTEMPLPTHIVEAIGAAAAVAILPRIAQQIIDPGIRSMSVSQNGLAQSFSGGGIDDLIRSYRQLYADNIQAVRADYTGPPVAVF